MIIFRADSSREMGMGHIMRCLTLAQELRKRGAVSHFVTRALEGHPADLIARMGFELSLLSAPDGPASALPPDNAAWAGVPWEQDLAETCAVIAEADWLIVDHYDLDARWQNGIADRVGRIMVIDDLADRIHAADLLLDQNLGRDASDYDSLVPATCRRLIGPHFALLRPEFTKFRSESLARRAKGRLSDLMISMGGMDMVDATSKVLEALPEAHLPKDLRITVVMGSHAPALGRVRALAADMTWPTRVLVDVSDMAALMAEADLAIGAGGGTTWERCCLGLPSIIVETAANQAGAVVAMKDAGAALGTGPLADPAFNDQLGAAIFKLMNLDVSARLSRASAELCDGQGATRVARYLVDALWA